MFRMVVILPTLLERVLARALPVKRFGNRPCFEMLEEAEHVFRRGYPLTLR
jgi:hypothetical protein